MSTEKKDVNDFFPSIRMHKDDIESRGYDASDLTVDELERMASKIGENLMEDWWMALDYYAETVLGLKQNKDGE